MQNRPPPHPASRVPLTALSITRAGLIGSIVVLAIAATCLRLGFWQLDRLQQRRARNAILIERLHAPPFRLERAPDDTAGLIYRRALVEGRFDHGRTIVLAGRSLQGVPGAYVLTPVLLTGGSAVLVNLGWLPAADAAHVNLDSIPHPTLAQLSGLVLPFPQPQRKTALGSSASDSTFRHLWYTVNPNAMRRQFPYSLGNIEVQALPDRNAPPFPVRLSPPATDEGPHLGYAIQWFSFAAIGLIGWIVLLLKRGDIILPKGN